MQVDMVAEKILPHHLIEMFGLITTAIILTVR